jgi:hypothetical protein
MVPRIRVPHEGSEEGGLNLIKGFRELLTELIPNIDLKPPGGKY